MTEQVIFACCEKLAFSAVIPSVTASCVLIGLSF